ncbi:hypothetical protein [Streptosporangium canum]|uniref:hypothetical protein n=1 Tax=Streptosporangium canum TaxID=324952 RepID=UPI0037899F87
MNPFARRKRSAAKIAAFLAKTHPNGSAREKLHALIIEVARTTGSVSDDDFSELAHRAGISIAMVDDMMAGQISHNAPKWWPIEELLKACDASPAYLEVAAALYTELETDRPASSTGALPRRSWESPRTGRFILRVNEALVWPPHLVASSAAATREAGRYKAASGPRGEVQETAQETKETAALHGPEGAVPASGGAAKRPHDQPAPEDAHTAAQFVQELIKYRISKDEPAYRAMAKAVKDRPDYACAYTTFRNVEQKKTLPSVQATRGFIAGCGGDDSEVKHWLFHRNRIRNKERQAG